MKKLLLSSSVVLAVLVAGVLALNPLEAIGHASSAAVVDISTSPSPELEVTPEEPEPENADSCMFCFESFPTVCNDRETDLGKRCGFSCRCGICEEGLFGCLPE